MLLNFAVENVLSFREYAELSMLSTGGRELPHHQLQVKKNDKSKLSVNKFAVLFGPNAGGKSNLLGALGAMSRLVKKCGIESSVDSKERYAPFRLDTVSAARPSTLQVTLHLDGIFYRYGFSLDSERFLDEWLWERRTADGEEICVFQRAQTNRYGRHAQAEIFERNDQHVSDTSLILTVNKSLKNPLCEKVFSFFAHTSFGFAPEAILAEMDIEDIPVLTSILKFADVGIRGLQKMEAEQNAEDLPDTMPPEMRNFFLYMLKNGANIKKQHLVFYHCGIEDAQDAVYAMDDSAESTGTRRFLALVARAMAVVRQKGLFVVDELEEGLHPLLVRGFIEFFASIATNGAQLLCSSHCPAIFDQDVLRRDALWIVEKDYQGVSSLCCTSDYDPRPDANLGKQYLEGRFSGIPHLQQQYLNDACTQFSAMMRGEAHGQ